MAIQFRCPHRAIKTDDPKLDGQISRDAKAAMRTKVYEVPAEAKWTRVDDEYSTGKETLPRYAHEIGARWEATVTCPDCGDVITISTDQNPEGN